MPKDVNIARIGSKGRRPRYEKAKFTRFLTANIGRQSVAISGHPLGHLIHAHCWALLNQTLGAPFNQTKLQKFVRAARKHWYKHKLWSILDDGFLLDGESESDLEMDSPDVEQPYNYSSNLYHSPLVIHEARSAIELAKDIENSSTSGFTNLPLELKVLIAQIVCPVNYQELDIQNAFNMLSAFGWTLPKSFWDLRLRVSKRWRFRLRIDERRLLFELNSLNISSAAWQSISLAILPLLCNRDKFVACGLANRERVLCLIDEILKKMEQSSC